MSYIRNINFVFFVVVFSFTVQSKRVPQSQRLVEDAVCQNDFAKFYTHSYLRFLDLFKVATEMDVLRYSVVEFEDQKTKKVTSKLVRQSGEDLLEKGILNESKKFEDYFKQKNLSMYLCLKKSLSVQPLKPFDINALENIPLSISALELHLKDPSSGSCFKVLLKESQGSLQLWREFDDKFMPFCSEELNRKLLTYSKSLLKKVNNSQSVDEVWEN